LSRITDGATSTESDAESDANEKGDLFEAK
jgi:hypothetical protein